MFVSVKFGVETTIKNRLVVEIGEEKNREVMRRKEGESGPCCPGKEEMQKFRPYLDLTKSEEKLEGWMTLYG